MRTPGLPPDIVFTKSFYTFAFASHTTNIISIFSVVCIFTRKIDDCPAYGGFSALETWRTITAEMLVL